MTMDPIAKILKEHWAARGKPKLGKVHPNGVDPDEPIDLCEEWHRGDCEAWARCRICQGQPDRGSGLEGDGGCERA